MVKHVPMVPADVEKLKRALDRNARDGGSILVNGRDTSFEGEDDGELTDREVVNAIKSVPVHYSEMPSVLSDFLRGLPDEDATAVLEWFGMCEDSEAVCDEMEELLTRATST